MKVLKLVNNIVENIEVWEELPSSSGNITYIEDLPTVDRHWRLLDDGTWENTVPTAWMPKKTDAEGNILKYFDSANNLDGEVDDLPAILQPDYDPNQD